MDEGYRFTEMAYAFPEWPAEEVTAQREQLRAFVAAVAEWGAQAVPDGPVSPTFEVARVTVSRDEAAPLLDHLLSRGLSPSLESPTGDYPPEVVEVYARHGVVITPEMQEAGRDLMAMRRVEQASDAALEEARATDAEVRVFCEERGPGWLHYNSLSILLDDGTETHGTVECWQVLMPPELRPRR